MNESETRVLLQRIVVAMDQIAQAQATIALIYASIHPPRPPVEEQTVNERNQAHEARAGATPFNTYLKRTPAE